MNTRVLRGKKIHTPYLQLMKDNMKMTLYHMIHNVILDVLEAKTEGPYT